MSDRGDFSIKFWGVRGSIACPGPETVRYGGNTTCLEIRCGGYPLVIDGGTGLRLLGSQLAKERPGRIDLFFTHTHFDHVVGVPFFQPAYLKDMTVHFWAGHLPEGQTLKHVLHDMMMAPLFPVPLHYFEDCEYHDFRPGQEIILGPGIRITSAPLNHPNGACGYRIEYGGKSICVVTDTEHVPNTPDENVLNLIRGADLMVYDSMFTDEEFPRFTGWGHSTWQEALRLADAADVKRAVVFHHDPNHDDAFMDQIARKASQRRPGTVIAQELMVLRP